MSSSSSFLEAHWSATGGIFRRLFCVSPHRAKEALHRAVKDDDDDDDVAKRIEIIMMVWKKKRAVLFVRDDDDKKDTNEIKKQVLRM